MHFHIPQVSSFTDLVRHQVKHVMKNYKHEKESEAHQVRHKRNFQLPSYPSMLHFIDNVSRYTGRPPAISLRVLFLKPLIQYVIELVIDIGSSIQKNHV